MASIGWLEQTEPGVFARHTLETGKMSHVTLDLGDYDGDGDVDMLVGNMIGFTFAKTDTGIESDSWAELWENRTPRVDAQRTAPADSSSHAPGTGSSE